MSAIQPSKSSFTWFWRKGETKLPYSLQCPCLLTLQRTLTCHIVFNVLDYLTPEGRGHSPAIQPSRSSISWHLRGHSPGIQPSTSSFTWHSRGHSPAIQPSKSLFTWHWRGGHSPAIQPLRSSFTWHSRGGHSPAIQPSKSSFTSSSRSFVCFHCPRIPLTPCRTCGTVSYLSSVAIQVLDSTRATSAGSVRHKKLQTNQLLLLQPSHSLKKFNTIKIWFHALALWYFSEIELQCTVAKNRTQCVASL